MRFLLFAISFAILIFSVSAQTAFVNEIDYDQPGADNNEFVEVAIDLTTCGGACNPAFFTLHLYRDSGTEYDDFSVGSSSVVDGDFNLFLIMTPGIQNGPGDGIALIYDDGTNPLVVVEFISYGSGTLTATNGPASGEIATNIGITDTNSGLINRSIERNADGTYSLGNPPTPGAPNASPLPVTLTTFNAKPTTSGAMLEWTTASEINNDFFSVEVSRDAANFSESAQVKGNGTTESLANYTYEFNNLAAGTYYFRLRQVDYDGQYAYSDVVSLTVAGDRDFHIVSNTVLDVVQLDVTTPRPVRILNLAGAVVADFNLGIGRNDLDISRLPNGMYILSDGKHAKRFIKQ